MTTTAADHIYGQRVGSKSVKNYTSKMNTIKTCIILENPEYIVINHMNVPFDLELIKKIFGWLSTNTKLPQRNRRHRVDEENEDIVPDDDDVYASSSVTISASCMQGYKSAILWYYKEKDVAMDPSINSWIDTFIQGYKRKVAEKKSAGIMRIQEGKSPLSFQGYNVLCKTLCTLKPEGHHYTFNEAVFGWAYTTLSWNTMGRSHSVGTIMFQHISWKDDSLLITFAKSKCDQTGEGLSNDKHIYANPLNPKVCPILALSVLVFTTYRNSDISQHKLFGGKDPEKRFCKILKQMLDMIPDQNNLGAPRKDLGSHSQRKGSATYALGFSILSAVQVYLRAGWSLGNVQDRYIFGGAGGDQIVGRAVCGLPVSSIDFSILPPHFSEEDLSLLNKIGWPNIIPGYENYPESFKQIVPWLLASLVYHNNWLVANFDRNHPLFQQFIYTKNYDLESLGRINIMNYFANRVLLGRNYCNKTCLQATGIPDNLAIAHQVQQLVGIIQKLEEETLPSFKDDIIEKIHEIPTNVKDLMLENFTIDGVVPINISDIQRIVSDAKTEILSKVCTKDDVLSDSPPQNIIERQEEKFNWFTWGGRMRMIPDNFVFPTVNVKTMWNLWFYGNESKKIQPYKYLVKNIQDLEKKTERTNVHRVNKVMTALVDIAIKFQLVDENVDISALSVERSNEIFNICFAELLKICYGDKGHSRAHDIQCNTIAHLLYTKLSGKKRSREESSVHDDN